MADDDRWDAVRAAAASAAIIYGCLRWQTVSVAGEARWYVHAGPVWWPALVEAVRSHEAEAFEVGERVWSQALAQRLSPGWSFVWASMPAASRPGQKSLFDGGGC